MEVDRVSDTIAARQEEGPVLDALVAAPDHHRVLLENEHVRVLDTKVRPGETTPIHVHPWPSVLYVLSWSDFVRYDPAGNVLSVLESSGG